MARFPGRRARTSAIAIVFLVAITTVAAQDLGYMGELPAVARVIADNRVGSARESAVRAHMALDKLAGVVQMLSQAKGRQPTPSEAAKVVEYRTAAAGVIKAEQAKAATLCGSGECEGDPIARCSADFMLLPEFSREVLDRYFSPQWQVQYAGALQGGGGVWRQALLLPPGTKTGRPDADADCADGSKTLAERTPTRTAVPTGPGLWESLVALVQGLSSGFIVLALVGLWAGRKFYNSRRLVVRRSNAAAMLPFPGATADAREQAIIAAFDAPDTAFQYDGVNPNRNHKMSFVLRRHIKSFKRGDLESMRFAYLAFNRGLIDDEKFHWYRFGAVYADGMTDPADAKFLGLVRLFRSKQTAIVSARESLKDFATINTGQDLESQALAQLQAIVAANPRDELFGEMRQRFIEGSHWLTRSDLKESVFALPGDPSPYYVRFGPLVGGGTELTYAKDASIITIAPPGAGKTECNVLPNLLHWPGPALVLDVKGELYDKTAGWRSRHVGPVIKFSPLDPDSSAHYNPLSVVRGEARYVWEDSKLIAELLMPPNADAGENRVFDDLARLLLTALIGDLCYWNKPEDRPMSKVIRILSRNGWNEFVERLRKNPEIEEMQDAGFSLISNAKDNPKMFDSVLQTAKSSLGAWTGHEIAQITKRSDWAPAELRNGQNRTIYICVNPGDIETYASVLRVFIAQHIRALMPRGERPRENLVPVLFVLDEFPQLGYMRPIEQALDTGRGYKIRLWMFVQNMGQLKTAYPNADGMIGNCAVQTFMNPSLHDGTAQKLAEAIGYRDAETHAGKALNEHADRKFKVDPQELAGPAFKEQQIIIGRSSKPAKVQKVYAYQSPELVEKMSETPADSKPH